MMIKAIDSTFAYLMQDVTRQLRKHFDRRATKFALTRAQWRALKTIRRNEGLSQTELADYLDMEPIPVGRVIDRLEKTGYVERRADPGDRRRWRLHLTPKAHAIVAEMEVIASGLRDDALRGVRREDFETLLRVLAQLKDNLVALDGATNEEKGTP
ncbi:MarR family transcriptional regulator [Dokdonella soli]|uniref:MarR family winged helix-turn-helix transcriptional regulator n=1 Tax=Dokdonella soli TaxID=529810 RepID=A0ABN1ILI5_9GAMM